MDRGVQYPLKTKLWVQESFEEDKIHIIFSNQLLNPATSSPADVHHYVIPPKVTIDQ
jgi:hypothetical protein